MVYWVYLLKDERGNFTTFLSSYLKRAISLIECKEKIVYIRPFTVPMDAVAHKHLLDDLSYDSLHRLVVRYKKQTEILLKK
jgi:hypothetical protein